MTTKRYLIVNADDFGQSCGVNRGVIKAHKQGIVTSASLMTRWPAAAEAAAYNREHQDFSLGLHVDLGEWVYRDGTWVPLYEVVPLSDISSVADEVAQQLSTFRRLVNRDPTHIDSHQHVHRREPVRSVLMDVAIKLAVPLRNYSPEIHYCGNFYGQTLEGSPLHDAISTDRLIQILFELPDGITEIGCHPGEGDDLDTMYGCERVEEVKTLSDPRVRASIVEMKIELCSFGNISSRGATLE